MQLKAVLHKAIAQACLVMVLLCSEQQHKAYEDGCWRCGCMKHELLRYVELYLPGLDATFHQSHFVVPSHLIEPVALLLLALNKLREHKTLKSLKSTLIKTL